MIGTDCIGSYKSNYYAITITTAPKSGPMKCMQTLQYTQDKLTFLS